MPEENTTNPFRDVTDAITVPLERVAEVVGRSYATVLAYRNGVRAAPPEVFELLADFIDQHHERMPAYSRLCRQHAARASRS